MTHTCQFEDHEACGIKTELFIMVGSYKLWLCTYHHDLSMQGQKLRGQCP